MAYVYSTIPFIDWLPLHEQDENPSARPDAFELDWWLITEDAGFGKLVSMLADQLGRVIPTQRQHAHRLPNLRALLASLFDAHDREPGKPTKYARKPAAYSDKDEDRPEWASGRLLVSLVDGLTVLGYVGGLKGWNDHPNRLAMLSLVWPLPDLIRLFEVWGLRRSAFRYPSTRRPVVLRASQRGSGHGKKLKCCVCFGAAAEIDRAAGPVIAFNHFMAGHEITLDRLPDGLEDRRHANLTRKACHRVFNNVDPAHPKLNRGGRFYGPGWQALASDLRPYLLIDSNPTVELDFGSLHPRMLYHLAGLEVDEDPYSVPGLSRQTAKTLINHLINATSRQIAAACQAPKDEIKRNWAIDLPEGWDLRAAFDAIKERHQAVASRFGKGEGLRLQNLDSEVCATILGSAINNKIPTLPIHDSFVVRQKDEEVMRMMMSDAYRCEVGNFEPIIKVKSRPEREPTSAIMTSEVPSRECLDLTSQWESKNEGSCGREWNEQTTNQEPPSSSPATYMEELIDQRYYRNQTKAGRLRTGENLWTELFSL